MTSANSRAAYGAKETEVLKKTEEFVRNKLASDSTGHDWWHVWRVRNNAMRVAQGENVNMFVVELAALLHDIADWKFNNGDSSLGPKVAREWLEGQLVDEEIIQHVCEIIDTASYRGAGTKSPMRTLEGMCVQDGDRLDALGAIGIGRTFSYGGYTGRLMHDPAVKPEMHVSFEQYKKSKGPTIAHFYEKLLLLKDRMNTEAAKKIAVERHQFMEKFLKQFYDEWEGKS